MPILYECYPTRDLRVIPDYVFSCKHHHNGLPGPVFSGRCVAISHNSLQVRGFAAWQRQQFDGGKTDKSVPVGEGSKLFELNVWAMTLGPARPPGQRTNRDRDGASCPRTCTSPHVHLPSPHVHLLAAAQLSAYGKPERRSATPVPCPTYPGSPRSTPPRPRSAGLLRQAGAADSVGRRQRSSPPSTPFGRPA